MANHSPPYIAANTVYLGCYSYYTIDSTRLKDPRRKVLNPPLPSKLAEDSRSTLLGEPTVLNTTSPLKAEGHHHLEIYPHHVFSLEPRTRHLHLPRRSDGLPERSLHHRVARRRALPSTAHGYPSGVARHVSHKQHDRSPEPVYEVCHKWEAGKSRLSRGWVKHRGPELSRGCNELCLRTERNSQLYICKQFPRSSLWGQSNRQAIVMRRV